MASVYGLLQYSFDDEKYGGCIFLTDQAKKTLNSSPLTVTSWQESDIANQLVTRNRYYQNPHASIISTLASTANLIASQANTANFFTLEAAALSYGSELNYFLSHTNNVSGVNEATAESADYPNWELATAVGQQVLRIVNTTDEISNSSPMLGSMTSLFIGDDLTSNNTILVENYNLLVNAAITESEALSNVTSANTLISTRRAHDWNFYQKSRALLDDYVFLSKFNNLGNTQSYIITNLIGTTYLKESLANTA